MIIQSAGAIRRITGRGQIRRLSGEAKLVQGRMLPRAQVGLVSDAVEVYDPSGILTVAQDLPDGPGVRLGVSGAVAASPAEAAWIAWPLLDPAGRAHPAYEGTTHFPPVHGYLGFPELSAWSTKGTPSGAAVFVGVTSGLPSGATNAIIIGSLNNVAGQQRCFFAYLRNGGEWQATVGNPDAAQSGAVTVLGEGQGTATQYSLCVLPWERGGGGVGQRASSFAGELQGWTLGEVPHLVVGVYQPVAGPGGIIEVSPRAELWASRLPRAR